MKPINAALCAATAALAVAMAFATPSQATDAGSGYVSIIYVMDNGAVLFNQDGVRTGTLPDCQGAGLRYRWAFDGSTPAGQAKLATLLTAYSTKKKITIIGKGFCTPGIHPDTELLNWFRIDE